MSAAPSLLAGLADVGDLVLLSPLAKSGLGITKASVIEIELLSDSVKSKDAQQPKDAYFLAYVKQLLGVPL